MADKLNQKDEPAPERDLDVNTETEHELAETRLRQQAIGVRLRHLFDEVVSEPVPDEFIAILQNADRRTKGSA